MDVATFLLNEKRADIHSIEARLKVNVVLIPNIHLETPNYQVERRRHDDLNQEGVLPASYNLVSTPASKEASLPEPTDSKPARAHAAVQNFTPGQPAPMPIAAAETPQKPSADEGKVGIIDRIMGWFKRAPQAAVASGKAPTVATSSTGARESRRDRTDRGNGRDNRNRREFSDGRPPREERRGDDRQGQGERQPRQRNSRGDSRQQDRGPRPERSPRDNRRESQVGATAQSPSASGREDGGSSQVSESTIRPEALPPAQEGERRRRRRGGRDRNRDSRESKVPDNAIAPDLVPVDANSPPQSAESESLPTSMSGPIEHKGLGESQSADQTTGTPAEPEVQRAKENATVIEVAPAPSLKMDLTASAPSNPISQPQVQSEGVAVDNLSEVLEQSGLVMVQTKGDRIAEAAPEPEFKPAKRTRRPPLPEVSMVQVQTRDDQSPAS